MKQVVSTFEESIRRIQDVNSTKIYVMDKGYKAHKLGNLSWAWVSLSNSECYANGIFDTLISLIDSATRRGWQVYEFDNLKEFAEWIAKETK